MEYLSISQHHTARPVQSQTRKNSAMPTSSTSALFFFARMKWRVPYMSSHTQLAPIADRTTNWDPRHAWIRRHQKLVAQQPITITSPGYGVSISRCSKCAPQILFVKSFHMLNCRRGIEIPGNVDMSRRCGTQMQRHTRGL